MTEISLKEFILTGKFGPLQLGMTEKQVIEILGKSECDVINEYDEGNLISIRYEGGFYFDISRMTDKLVNIANKTLSATYIKHLKFSQEKLILNKRFCIDPYFFHFGKLVNYRQVSGFFKREKIKFKKKIRTYKTLDLKYVDMTFESDVKLDFEDCKISKKEKDAIFNSNLQRIGISNWDLYS